MEDLITIEEILTEANAYGMRDRVQELAIAYNTISHLGLVDAYQIAFNHLTENLNSTT